MTELSLFWDPDDDLEDVRQYAPGGYHPVRLGDIMPPQRINSQTQYRILHKLGHGAFATVWLAETLHRSSTSSSTRYVALKICAARADPQHELDVFARLPTDESPNVVQLLDGFTLQGPNGRHAVLVHNVLGSLKDAVCLPAGRKQVKNLCRQIADGLAIIHRHGIAHGDIHSSNIGIALPSLDDHPSRDILDYFGNPECTIVLPTRPHSNPDSLPPYLVRPISILDYLLRNDSSFAETPFRAQVADFGNAILVASEQPRPSCTPVAVCAPELLFERVIYEIVFGSTLFRLASANDVTLGKMATLCGEVPSSWRSYWDSCESLKKLGISQETADAEWAQRIEHYAENVPKIVDDSTASSDAARLVSLLRSMLKMEPCARPSVEEVLLHPWLALQEDAAG
ncbi:uncharacterized protein PHACADRAFT_170828 [Phanerochaete carnosa HHB-10118-sp]|uniref:non-specific serine/threonine protein kinase n=1 Tax=Phanerochaete carnosa (strain HHB-10118-sp) TaxID=650164 RepID=K5X431_PHACS|nr:uncharacterized protein PHACADRAFT_170828 [Phanerochaete carnosa HHB-10118-sp]EKM57592.1 hypothetical protein PHACADRAFT_170828 [Phanerochaete carnosa HHB-10118-sp]